MKHRRASNPSSWVFLLGVVGLFVATPLPLFAAESIERFESTIAIDRDATISVEETITYDFGTAERHGIFRFIPTAHPQEASAWYKSRGTDLSLQSVTMDGAAVPYEIDESGDEVRVKIGDADTTISGVHTYTISYTVIGALSYFETEPPELYWNVTGSQWEVPIHEAVANVIAPAELIGDARTCYAGIPGTGTAESGTCTTTVATGTVTFTATDLAPGEELTIAQSLHPDAVAVQVHEELRLVLLWGGVMALWLLWLLYRVYHHVFRYRTNRSIYAQYEPYEDFKPMFTGVLLDGRLDARDIAAGILYLAEQGFLKITHTKDKVFLVFSVDDYEVTLRRPVSEVESDFLQQVISLLFDDSAKVGSTTRLSELKKNTSQQKKNYKTVQALKRAVERDLRARGFYEHALLLRKSEWIAAAFIVGGLLLSTFIDLQAAIIMLLLFATVTVAMVALAYRRRTKKGYDARHHLLGFKDFLKTTDSERFTFHNAPEKSPELFMRYLPYAIAFSVEDEWAEVFKDITIPEPEWYEGGGRSFAPTAFAHDLSSFSSTVTSSTGSSASSGGGSAGGGAGGGGGGSW